MKKKIAIIDYQMSNMFSVENALRSLGFEAEITSEREEIMSSEGAVLPGVGAFGEAMKKLEDFNLVQTIKDFIASGKPFMGICLGLQLLFSESEEFGLNPGLDIIKGRVRGFSNQKKISKVVHVGWNKISKFGESGALSQTPNGSYAYFVHSFFVDPEDKELVASTTEYDGFSFVSSIRYKNIYACQFHRKKAGPLD